MSNPSSYCRRSYQLFQTCRWSSGNGSTAVYSLTSRATLIFGNGGSCSRPESLRCWLTPFHARLMPPNVSSIDLARVSGTPNRSLKLPGPASVDAAFQILDEATSSMSTKKTCVSQWKLPSIWLLPWLRRGHDPDHSENCSEVDTTSLRPASL